MTEKEANLRLKLKERFYFQNNFSVNQTTYAAVIKKSDNINITDDYIIEIGYDNFSLKYDKKLDSIPKSKIVRLFNKIIANDFFMGQIQFEPTAKVKLQREDGAYTKKLKKLSGGCSIFYQNSNENSGTAGAFFKIDSEESIYLISNRHVMVDNDLENKTKIVHPAHADAAFNHEEEVIIGNVCWASEEDSQEFDAAIAKVIFQVDEGKYTLANNTKFNKIAHPKIGESISKCGRTTGFKEGKIRSINCTVNVSENSEYFRFFRNQILTTCISLPGDSGSVVVNQDNNLVGLLFAGDEKTASFCNIIHNVFEATKNYKVSNIKKFV